MKTLPCELLQLLATLPDEQPCKVVLNTNGQGHWEVEVFARHSFDAQGEPLPLDAYVTKMEDTLTKESVLRNV